MISPHPRLQVNVAEQFARSIVAAARTPSPNLFGANESRSLVGGERLFQQPVRAVRCQDPAEINDWKRRNLGDMSGSCWTTTSAKGVLRA
jgi:hypothetical protein